MKAIAIKIQSFVDIITNSSTEVFAIADNGTVEHFKKLVNSLMNLSNSELKAEDMFNFQLDAIEDEYTYKCDLIVTPKAPEFNEAAKLLESLIDSYGLDYTDD